MEGMDWKGCVCRMRNCVLDLLSMEEDLEEEEDEETWELMSTTLRLKSTFLFCDFNQVISSARDERQKALLTDLANKLFYNLEQLDGAVKSRSMSVTQSRYTDAALVLQEVTAVLAL